MASSMAQPRTIAALVAGLGAASCIAAGEPVRELTIEQRGMALFTDETFDGNGRTCNTCHDLERFGTITPEVVRERFAADPQDPLFRAIDSDDGLGASYQRLLEHATMRVPIDLPVHESGFSIRMCHAPAVTKVVMHRGNPSIFNVALEDRLMVDGREGSDLETQALNAVRTHSEPHREPMPDELAAIAAFEQSLFSHEAIRDFVAQRAGLGLPPGNTDSEQRGRRFFDPDGQCGVCHSGPMLNQTSESHEFVVGARFDSAEVGEEEGNPGERVWWCFVDPATDRVVPGPLGDTLVFDYPVVDPGLGLVRGSTTFTRVSGEEITVSNDIAVAGARVPLFKIPTLWGVANTAPYFHDNSAKTLEAVLEHYDVMAALPGCEPETRPCLSEQDRADIIAYLQLLSFERPALALAAVNPDTGQKP